MKKTIGLILLFFIAFTTMPNEAISQTVTSASLGTATSSSATRGPFQRSDMNSSSVFSRAHLVYSQAEVLTTLGIVPGSTISQINWDLGSTNIITASGNATLDIYLKNSNLANAALDSWANVISGATLSGSYVFNTANNFPGAEGFMGFALSTPFVYTGGTLEIAVDWDCSALVPANAAMPNLLFSGNGSLNWHWDATAHTSLVYRAGASSAPTQLSSANNLKSERVNTQFVYTLPPSCTAIPVCSNALGTGTSSSATRGPFQRSDMNSSSVYSRAQLLYSQAELLSNLGITAGSSISEVKWDLGSTNIITASGNATVDIYMKNSTLANAVLDSWANISSGATLVGSYTFNTANNFPGAEGFMTFPLNSSFVYTGNSLEVLVDWDCSALVPANAAMPNLLFSGNGSLNWHWDATVHTSFVYRAGTSGPPTQLTSASNLKSERVNTMFTYAFPSACDAPLTLTASNITSTTADLSWSADMCANVYHWIVVPAGAGPGGTPVASGTSSTSMATATGLSATAMYDYYVQSDCGNGNLSVFSNAFSFTTTGVACPNNLVLSGPNTTSGIIEAKFNISSTEIISGGAVIDYSAGTDIDLDSGFEVITASEFHAYILGCI